MANKKDLEIAELRGVGKILNTLWDNSYNSMGVKAAARIRKEMAYYFGEAWAINMYKIIEERGKPHYIKPIKTLTELTLK